MNPRDSAYEALGLRPGASRTEVDEAYRRLIKLHHPDRAGGDPDRAADVNRAYTLLRQQRLAVGPQSRPVPVVLHPKPKPRSRWTDWLFTAVLLGIVVGGVGMQMSRGKTILSQPLKVRWPVADTSFQSARANPLISFDQPLNLAIIDSAIAQATKYAAEVPLKVMETASKSYELLAEMAERGNPASVSDVGVGALATRACIEGAALNVRINLAQLKDERFKTALLKKIEQISTDSDTQFKTIYQLVGSKLR